MVTLELLEQILTVRQAMGNLLRLAKPHLVSCEYEVMENGKENVKVICKNGHCSVNCR